MEDIIGILLHNSFMKLSGSNQIFGEKQGLFSLPRVRQTERKEFVAYYVASDKLRRFEGKSKENCVTVSNCTTHKTFLRFCLKIA